MGGIVGATSSKFVVMGALLLVQGRIDGNSATLAIAPMATTSAISTRFAEKLGAHADGRPLQVHIRREFFTASIAGRENSPANGADARLGMDVLAANPIVIDFKSHSMHLIDNHQLDEMPSHYVRINVDTDRDGRALIGLRGRASGPRAVRLNSTGSAIQNPSALAGDECLTDPPPSPQSAAETVGLEVFRDQTVIFDVARHVIWVRKSVQAARLLCSEAGTSSD